MKNIFLISIFLITILSLSCQKTKEKEENSGGHAHTEDEMPNVTGNAFGKYFEVFFEAPALIVDKSSNFLIHVNDLKNFKPLLNGRVKIQLFNKDNSYSNETDKISKEGIFKTFINPGKKAVYDIKIIVESNNLTDTLITKEVIVFKDVEGAVHSKYANKDPNEIEYLKEQMWKTDFASEEIRMKEFSEIIKTVGEILPAQGEKRVVSAKTNGVLLYTMNPLVIGKKVNRGRQLFTISGGAIGEENMSLNFKQKKNDFESSKIQYERNKKLSPDKVVSQKELQESETKYVSDSLSYYNYLRNFNKNGASVRSPISGYIQNLLAEEGQYVTTGQPIAMISANKRMMIRADIPLRYYSSAGKVNSAVFKIPFTNKTLTSEELQGKIISKSTSVQSEGKFIPVFFDVDNNGSLIEGIFIECFLKAAPIANQIVLPKTSLVEELGSFYVFVQTDGESFLKRKVEVGADDGLNIQILEGLALGERVVTEGAMQVKLVSLSAGGGDAHAGHSH